MMYSFPGCGGKNVNHPSAVCLRPDHRQFFVQPLFDRIHVENALTRRQEAALRIFRELFLRPVARSSPCISRRNPICSAVSLYFCISSSSSSVNSTISTSRL